MNRHNPVYINQILIANAVLFIIIGLLVRVTNPTLTETQLMIDFAPLWLLMFIFMAGMLWIKSRFSRWTATPAAPLPPKRHP